MAWPNLLSVAVLTIGCGSVEEVSLQLVDSDGDCALIDIEAVRTMSVEVLADNGSCKIEHECVNNVAATDLEGLGEAMRAEGEVLVSVDPEVADQLAVVGRPRTYGCFTDPVDNPPILCGVVSLDRRDTGALVIEIDCGVEVCGDPGIELCPE